MQAPPTAARAAGPGLQRRPPGVGGAAIPGLELAAKVGDAIRPWAGWRFGPPCARIGPGDGGGLRMTSFRTSIQTYEAWLRHGLAGQLVEADLKEKHRRMRRSALAFLRGSCWRWAEQAAGLCPEVASGPVVMAIGDAHVENFGVWRDREGRLVWGVNDFDEAARTAFGFDLVRLAASAMVAAGEGRGPSAEAVAEAVLEGYVQGLQTPRPLILESANGLLDELVRPGRKQRLGFWAEMARVKPAEIPPRYRAILQAALPAEPDPVMAPRRAGMGSLGRPRFLAVGSDPRCPVAREAKGLVPSCWEPRAEVAAMGRRFLALARGPHRSPDPWIDVFEGVKICRLAPDGRKLEFEDLGRRVGRRLLTAMGWEVANIHAADDSRRHLVLTDLKRRPRGWLRHAAAAAADAAMADWNAYRS